MNTSENGYWITESITYKIFADSEKEARTIWHKYWTEGEPVESLPIKIKDGGAEADWDWELDE